MKLLPVKMTEKPHSERGNKKILEDFVSLPQPPPIIKQESHHHKRQFIFGLLLKTINVCTGNVLVS